MIRPYKKILYPIKAKIVHFGQDYAIIQVGTKEFEVSLGLALAVERQIIKQLKK